MNDFEYGSGSLSLYAENLLEPSDDPNQIALVVHDGIDVLVGGGDLIEHFGILSTFNARRLRFEVRRRVRALGSPAAQATTGSV